MKTQKRILIANRGEIAIRIARAIRELGHVAVGVWTDNEPNASHLEYCHEWVHLPGSNNQETFLDINKILAVIREYRIDAVHPGYGFLSENAGFARQVQDENVVFIGPNSECIKNM